MRELAVIVATLAGLPGGLAVAIAWSLLLPGAQALLLAVLLMPVGAWVAGYGVAALTEPRTPRRPNA